MTLHRDPILQFQRWFNEASDNGVVLPEASCLSTMGNSDYPDGRMVLVKSFDRYGFIFYTNAKSEKGKQLQRNRKASLTFYWEPITKQVRIQGDVSQVSNAVADSYFSTRPRGSQLGRLDLNSQGRSTSVDTHGYGGPDLSGKRVRRPPRR